MTNKQLNELIDDTTPVFVNSGLTRDDIAAIQRGGCASGAYMPAVTYHEALETMSEHGDEVMEYLDGYEGAQESGFTWSQMAVHYLSAAVELWAGGFDLDINDECDDCFEGEDECECD